MSVDRNGTPRAETLALEAMQIVVDANEFEGDVLGIVGISHINASLGKKKAISPAFTERRGRPSARSTACFFARKIQLQYAASGPKLYKVLGVEGRRSTEAIVYPARCAAG